MKESTWLTLFFVVWIVALCATVPIHLTAKDRYAAECLTLAQAGQDIRQIPKCMEK